MKRSSGSWRPKLRLGRSSSRSKSAEKTAKDEAKDKTVNNDIASEGSGSPPRTKPTQDMSDSSGSPPRGGAGKEAVGKNENAESPSRPDMSDSSGSPPRNDPDEEDVGDNQNVGSPSHLNMIESSGSPPRGEPDEEAVGENENIGSPSRLDKVLESILADADEDKGDIQKIDTSELHSISFEEDKSPGSDGLIHEGMQVESSSPSFDSAEKVENAHDDPSVASRPFDEMRAPISQVVENTEKQPEIEVTLLPKTVHFDSPARAKQAIAEETEASREVKSVSEEQDQDANAEDAKYLKALRDAGKEKSLRKRKEKNMIKIAQQLHASTEKVNIQQKTIEELKLKIKELEEQQTPQSQQSPGALTVAAAAPLKEDPTAQAVADQKARESQIAELSKEKDQLEEELRQAKEDMALAKEQAVRAQKAEDDYFNISEQLRNAVASNEKTIALLRSDKESLKQTVEQLRQDSLASTQKIDELRRDLDEEKEKESGSSAELQEPLRKLNFDLDAKEKTIEELRSKLARYEETSQERSKDSTNPTGDAPDREMVIQQLRSELDSKEADLQQVLQKQVGEANKELSHLRGTLETKTARIAELENKNALLEENIQAVEKERTEKLQSITKEIEAKMQKDLQAEIEAKEEMFQKEREATEKNIKDMAAKLLSKTEDVSPFQGVTPQFLSLHRSQY